MAEGNNANSLERIFLSALVYNRTGVLLRVASLFARRGYNVISTIDYLTLQAQDNHVQRLRDKKCHTASGVIFTKALQDLERVGDHSYNIAWAARIDKNLIRQI